MKNSRFTRIAAALLLLTASACTSFIDEGAEESEAADNRPRTPGGIPYAKRCAKTQCQNECQAENAQECAECNSACWSIMTGGGSVSCVETCADACQPSCGHCSDDSPCVEATYDFDYPWREDAKSVSACHAAGACLRNPELCSNDSITMDPDMAVQYYSCKQAHCDWTDLPACLPPGGKLASQGRATGCYPEWVDATETYLNGLFHLMRPEVQATLAWCYSLGDCAEVRACADGAQYPYP